MNGLMDTMQKWFVPRRRAERLVMARLDARRGEGELRPVDEAWLNARLAADADLQLFEREQEALRSVIAPLARASAPAGFAARVRQVAETRRKDSLPDLGGPVAVGRPDEPRVSWMWAAGAAVVAAVVLAVVVRPPDPRVPPPTGGLEVSGPSAGALVEPDFIVRAPGIGVARARVQIVSILERYGHQVVEEPGRLQVRLPRSELVPVLQDLARAGAFKVTSVSDAGPPETETVVVRFVLD